MSAHLFTTGRDGDATLVRIAPDRIDLMIADDLRDGLRGALAAGDGDVVIDMANVTFLDSSGLGALVSVRRNLSESRAIRLRNPSPFVREVLRLTKLDRVFHV